MSRDFLSDPANLRAIADDTYDWETWVGPDGVVLWVNPAVRRMTGYDPEACLAMPDYPLPLVSEGDRDRITQVLRSAREGSSGNDLEFRVRHRDGGERWVAMSWQSTFNARGERLGYRTSVRDIDDRKRLELRLSEALARAEAADRAKTQFLAMMSHELRTPLQCVTGYAELLSQSDLSGHQRRLLHVLRDQSLASIEMVESVLQAASLGLGKLPVRSTPVDVAALVQDAAEAARALVGSRPLQIQLEVDDRLGRPLRADAGKLRQIVSNLLSNAVKFTERGEVRLRLRVLPASEGTRAAVHIEVEDTGPGVDPSLGTRVFEPFVQGEGTRGRSRGGAGLGLAIARGFARAMGGDLRLCDTVQGACFRCELEAELTNECGADAEEPARLGTGPVRVDRNLAARLPRRILLADDSAPSRSLLAELLQLHGYEPELSEDGAQAVERAQSQPFDLIFVDLQMPRLSGAAVVRALRASGASRSARIIGITANLFAHEDPEVMAAGFDEILVKPVLLGRLSALLGAEAVTEAGAGVAAAPGRLDPAVVADLRATPSAGTFPHLFAKLAQRVLDAEPLLVTQIGAAVAGGDTARLRSLCHTLRGNCLLVGGGVPAAAAARLHDAADASAQEQRRRHAQLLDALHEFSSDLRRAMAEP